MILRSKAQLVGGFSQVQIPKYHVTETEGPTMEVHFGGCWHVVCFLLLFSACNYVSR